MKVNLLIVAFVFFHNLMLIGQNNATSQKNILTLAHEKTAAIEEFKITEKGFFKVRLYAIDTPITNKTQHWFLQIKDKNNNDVNYGSVNLEGYLKNDSRIKLNYIAPVFAMCNQGKYVIGFVKVKQIGVWILNMTIESAELKDNIAMEITVGTEKKAN